MNCPVCGFELKENVTICPNCGAGMGDDRLIVDEGSEAAAAAESAVPEAGTEPVEDGVPADAEDGGQVVSPVPGDGGDVPPEKPKRKKALLIICLLALAAALITIFAVRYYREHYIAHEIHLSENSLDLIVGDTSQLLAEILPETTKNKTVTWTSSDDAVASVDENGLVTAIGSGHCEITAATNNGFTDVCTVGVKDLIDIQKESIDAVVNYIKANNPEESDGVSVARIRDIDDEKTFALGTVDDDLVLCYRDSVAMDSVGVDVEYTTYLNLAYGDIENAEIVQDNQVEIFGYPVSTVMKGGISLPEYKKGDAVEISSFESNLEGMEANEEIRKMFNSGVMGCYEEFRTFLEYHPELGTTIEDFGFTALGDSPDLIKNTSRETPEDEASSMVESVAESAAESAVTVIEDIAVPAAVESEVPGVESSTEAAPEDVMPAVLPAGAGTGSVAEAPAAVPETPMSVAEEAAASSDVEEIPPVSGAEIAAMAETPDVEETAPVSGAEIAEDAAYAGAAAAAAAPVMPASEAEMPETPASIAEEPVAEAAETAESAVEEAAETAESAVEEAVEAAESAVEEAADAVTEGAAAAAGAVGAAAGEALTAAEDQAAGAASTVEEAVSVVEEAADAALDTAAAAAGAAAGAAQAAAGEIQEAAEEAASSMEAAVEEIAGAVPFPDAESGISGAESVEEAVRMTDSGELFESLAEVFSGQSGVSFPFAHVIVC